LGNDTVALNNPVSGTYGSVNAGSGIGVNVTGLAISGTSASNYQLASTATTGNVGVITPATLTASLTGSVSKVYDTTNAASLASGNYQLQGVLGSDTVALNNPVSGTYGSVNAGNGIGVNVTGLTISGTSASNYQLASTSTAGNVGVITPATLTASLTGSVNKVYDTTNAATLASNNYQLNGVLGNDSVSLNNPVNGNYSDVNAGSGIGVNVTGLAISGTSASNYQLAATSTTGNVGVITPATLTASLTGSVSKVYDTTNAATLASGNYQLQGVLGSDTVALNNPVSGTYGSVNAGSGIGVNVTGLAISGASASNYQLVSTSTAGNVGVITPATLTASLTGSVSKVYDTTNAASLATNNYQLTGVLGNDTVSLNNPVSGTYGSVNAGSGIGVNVTGLAISGSSASNYQLASTATTGNVGVITPATLTANLTGSVSKIYDATSAATLASNNYQLNGVLGNDTVSLNNPVNGTYGSINAGNSIGVNVTGLALSGASASNYQLASTSAASNIGVITPATLTASLTGSVSKVYDTTSAATLVSGNYKLNGVYGNDAVTLNDPVNGTYSGVNAGHNIGVSVTGLAISGASAENYQLAANSATGNVGVITPATLIASLTGNISKVYNGNNVASLTSANYLLRGILVNDIVALNDPANGIYNSTHVGSSIGVTVTGLRLNGVDANNYQLSSTTISGNIGTITAPKTIPVNPSAVANKLLGIVASQNLYSPNVINAALPAKSASPISITIGNQILAANESAVPMFNSSKASSIISASLRHPAATSVVAESLPGDYKNKVNSQAAMETTSAIALIRPIDSFENLLLLSAWLIMSGVLTYIVGTRKGLYSQFPAISFKLRSAMNTIMGFTQLMRGGSFGHISTEQKKLLNSVLDQSNTLISRFENLESKLGNSQLDAKTIQQMSFELRTALNGIIGFISLIYHGRVGAVSLQQRKFLHDILRASNQIVNLVPVNGKLSA